MKRNLCFLFLMVAGLTGASEIYAQDSISPGPDKTEQSDTYVWVNLGGGNLQHAKLNNLMAAGVNLSFQRKIHIVSIKYLYAEQFLSIFSPPDKLSSLDWMYGLSYKKKQWYGSLSTGINYSVFDDEQYFFRRKIFGIPLDAQLFLTFRWVGIGINGFAVFNKNFSFYGGLICIQFGKLR